MKKIFALLCLLNLLLVFLGCDLLGFGSDNDNIQYFTISFEVKEHGTAPASQRVVFGGKISEVAPSNIETGWSFVGWYLTSDCNGTAWNFSNDTVTTNIILYSSWTDIPKLTWNLDGGTNKSIVGTYTPDGYYTAGTTITSPTSVEKTGYIFKGWNPDVSSTMPENSIEYNAQWEAKTYTITLDRNTSETGSLDGEIVLTYGSNTVSFTSNTTRPYCTVEGYYTDENCTQKIMTSNGNLIASVSGWTDSSRSWSKDWTDTTRKFYVKWDLPYLCFTANEANSTVALNKKGSPAPADLETSVDNGETWDEYTFINATSGTIISLEKEGDKVYFRRSSTDLATKFGINGSNFYNFSMSGSISASGNIMSLIDKTCKSTTIPSCFCCFYFLFSRCEALTTAPELPATKLGIYCYDGMFDSCWNLKVPPELPATTLANSCYVLMFSGCINLTTAPKLPATILADSCYESMFYGCLSLKMAPELPATTLVPQCYKCMFEGCSKLCFSTSMTGAYSQPYRIPKEGNISVSATDWNKGMFSDTGGTFTGDPDINTTYYTNATVI